MNIRTSSYVALFSMPAVYAVLWVADNQIVGAIGLLLIFGGFILGIVTCCRAAKGGDRASRNRSIGGIALNGIYLGFIFYVIFFVILVKQSLANEINKEAQLKGQQQQSQSPSLQPHDSQPPK